MSRARTHFSNDIHCHIQWVGLSVSLWRAFDWEGMPCVKGVRVFSASSFFQNYFLLWWPGKDSRRCSTAIEYHANSNEWGMISTQYIPLYSEGIFGLTFNLLNWTTPGWKCCRVRVRVVELFIKTLSQFIFSPSTVFNHMVIKLKKNCSIYIYIYSKYNSLCNHSLDLGGSGEDIACMYICIKGSGM